MYESKWEEESHSVKIQVLTDSIQEETGEETSTDEVECMLSNLIFKGWIKGYIAHGNTLNLSKKEPFPDIGLVVEKNSSKL